MQPMQRHHNAAHGHQDEVMGAKTVEERKRLLGAEAKARATAAEERAAAVARLAAAVRNARTSGDPLSSADLLALEVLLSQG